MARNKNNVNEEYLKYISKRPSAWKGHAQFAIDIVNELKPNVIVDLGVDYGFSTFCLAYPNIGNVYGIDWFAGDVHTGKRNTYDIVLEQYNYIRKQYSISNIQFIKGKFDDIAKVWRSNIDLLHIDGLHTYEAVTNDFNVWSKFTNDNSAIMFHDVESFKDSVGLFFNEITGGYKIIKSGSAGLGIFTKNKEIYEKIKIIGKNDILY